MADDPTNLSFLYKNEPQSFPEPQPDQSVQQPNQFDPSFNNNNQFNQYNDQYQMSSQYPNNNNQNLNRQNSETAPNTGWKINLNDTIPEQTNMSSMQQNFSNSRGLDNQQQNQMMLNEIHDFYAKDEQDNDGEHKAEAKKKAASEFRQYMMTKFPNRYFILKKITSKNDIWTSCCLEKNWVVIDEVNQAKKLQNCYEISVNVYLIFMSVEQKCFLGYAKVISDIYEAEFVEA